MPVITCNDFLTIVLLHISRVPHSRPTLSFSPSLTAPYYTKLRNVCCKLPEKSRDKVCLIEEPPWLTGEVALSVALLWAYKSSEPRDSQAIPDCAIAIQPFIPLQPFVAAPLSPRDYQFYVQGSSAIKALSPRSPSSRINYVSAKYAHRHYYGSLSVGL